MSETTFTGGSWHPSDEIVLNEQSFTVQESTWCLPLSFKCIPGLLYDRHARNQPYERVSLIQYGEATRNWPVFFMLFFLAIMFGCASGVYTGKPTTGLVTFIVIAIVAFLAVLMLRESMMVLWTAQRTWPLVGGALRFFTKPGEAFAVAQAFVNRHAYTCRLTPPKLEEMEVMVEHKTATGYTVLCSSGDYVIVRTEKYILPYVKCFMADVNYIFPKADIAFLSLARKGRNIAYLIFCTALGGGIGAAAKYTNTGLIIGGILGVILYLGSHTQAVTFGLNNNTFLAASIPGGHDMRSLGLDLVRGGFPAAMHQQIRRDIEPVQRIDGYTPSSTELPRAINPAIFVIKFIFHLIRSFFVALILFVTCQWLRRVFLPKTYKPSGRTSAVLSIYQHHMETYTAPVVRCCCMQFTEGPAHYFVSNLFAYGEDTYISVLHNTSVITSKSPGVRDSVYFIFIGLLGAGFAGNSSRVAAAVALGSMVFTALMLYVMRAAYVYVGDNERNVFTDLRAREGHHVEFAALNENPVDLVNKLAAARQESIAVIQQYGGYLAHKHIVSNV